MLLSGQFSKFVVVGGIAALINFVSRIFFSYAISYRWAIVWAYLLGMLTAYVLQRIFVFAASGKHPLKEFVHFTLVNMVAIIQVWVISVGLAEYLFPSLGFEWFAKEIAHAIGITIPAISSYYGHKYISFKKAIDS